MALGHHEMLNHIWIKRALKPGTLTAGSTINTYNSSGQGMSGSVDQWDADKAKFQKLLIIVDLATITAGTLTISLRDDSAALTNANGDANSNNVVSFAALSAAGLYYFELPMNKRWASTTTRYGTNETTYGYQIMRYISLRAVAATGNSTFSSLFVFGGNLGGFVAQDGTAMTATYAT